MRSASGAVFASITRGVFQAIGAQPASASRGGSSVSTAISIRTMRIPASCLCRGPLAIPSRAGRAARDGFK